MKKTSKIPVWPIYVADALMFVAVFAVALPNLYTGEPLSASTVFMCTLMVIGGLLLCLAPFYTGLKNAALEEKASADAKVQDDLRIIFDELAALRLMIADIEEREETYPARIESLEKNLEKTGDSVSREDLAKLASDMSEAVKAKLAQIGESLESIAAEAEQCRSSQKDSDKIVAELCSDITILKDLLPASSESLTDEIYALKTRVENIEDSLKSAPEDTSDDDEPADGEDDEFFDEPTPEANSKQSESMLGRALAASESTKDSVEKFISRTSANKEVETSPEPENNNASENTTADIDDVKREFEKIAGDIAFENGGENSETEAEQNQESSNETGNSGDTQNTTESDAAKPESIEDTFSSTEPTPEPQTKKDDADFFESSDSLSGLGESQNVKPEAATLFELPKLLAKAPKPKKGDMAVTINALIGIGNKPFLRGVGGGLNPDKGVAMEYVEIGKWRYIFPESDSPVEFAVLKNDEVQSDGLEKFKILPNERLELNLSFPL